MDYTMDQRVKRMDGPAWLKSVFTPDHLKERDLLSFRGAEFEFPTCPVFCESIASFASQGAFGFNVMGEKYRKSVCWWMENVRKNVIDENWILPVHGTIYSLATSIRMNLKEGEGLIILTPGYNRYEQAATRLNRKTVKVPMTLQNGYYQMNWEALENAMKAPENKVFAFSNPNNPSGKIFSEKELQKIAELAQKYQVFVLCDEIFADVALYGQLVPVYAKVAGPRALGMSVTGFGKTLSLTGVNHANVLIANPQLYEAYKKQRDADHYGSMDPMMAAGLIGTMNEKGAAWLEDLKAYIQQNLETIQNFMKEKLPEARVLVPQAGYVVWIDYRGLKLSGEELHQFLSVDGGFDGDEGEEYYGEEGFYRYCLALPAPDVKKSLRELEKAVNARFPKN